MDFVPPYSLVLNISRFKIEVKYEVIIIKIAFWNLYEKKTTMPKATKLRNIVKVVMQFYINNN